MKVAIHVSSSLHLFPKAYNAPLAIEMALSFPEDYFILIFDNPLDIPEPLPSNCECLLAGPKIKNWPTLLFYYRYVLPKKIKLIQPDVFISAGDYSHKKIKTPQALILHTESYQKKWFQRFLYLVSTTALKYAPISFVSTGVAPEKGIMIFPGLEEAFAISVPEDIIKTQELISYGCAYFIYACDRRQPDALIVLLKAFSQFKKWQKSEMKLIIYADDEAKIEIADFNHYKYKDDVVLLNRKSRVSFPALLGSTYAGITLSALEWNEPGLLMMQSGVPVIAADTPEAKMMFLEAALYASMSHDELSQKMILLYKDETMRNEKIARGFERASMFSWKKTALLIRDAISTHKVLPLAHN